jgi:hypothetical protein
METEANNKITFLHIHVIKIESSIITTVYRKPKHTGLYLNFHSNNSTHVKRGIIRSLYKRVTIICRERQDLDHEVNSLKHYLQLNGFPSNLINSVINNTGGNNRLRNDVKPIGLEVIPYVNSISVNFKRIGNP